jgi:hypothetical protein
LLHSRRVLGGRRSEARGCGHGRCKDRSAPIDRDEGIRRGPVRGGGGVRGENCCAGDAPRGGWPAYRPAPDRLSSAGRRSCSTRARWCPSAPARVPAAGAGRPSASTMGWSMAHRDGDLPRSDRPAPPGPRGAAPGRRGISRSIGSGWKGHHDRNSPAPMAAQLRRRARARMLRRRNASLVRGTKRPLGFGSLKRLRSEKSLNMLPRARWELQGAGAAGRVKPHRIRSRPSPLQPMYPSPLRRSRMIVSSSGS